MLLGPLIPGQTPLHDLSGLRIKTIRTLAQLNAAEAENILKATMKYLVSKPTQKMARFDVDWMKKLHVEMFGDIWSWAGELRKNKTNIGSVPHQIEIDFHNLAADLGAWKKSSMPILEQAVRLHHAAVRIHPFLNGNGRWSRMLANVWLALYDSPLIEWPETIIGTTSTIREEYLDAVREADRGHISKLLDLHIQFVRLP